MVSKETLVIVGIIGVGFAAIGGLTLVKPAIKNARDVKNTIKNKINERSKSG